MAAEVELKLALDRAALPRLAELLRHPSIVAARKGRARTRRLVGTYYDTPDFLLERSGVALRLRREGERWVQAVKGPPAEGAGVMSAHDEHEWRLARPRLDFDRLGSTPWRKLLAKARKRGLAAVFSTDVVRREVPLAFADGTTATLAVDVGAIRTKRAPVRSIHVAELEIEIGRGGAAPVYALAQELVLNWPLAIQTATKAARGLALARGEPPDWRAPVRAASAAFEPAGGAEDALRAILQECVRQVAGNAAGLLADADPEWVHQMRIGTRRLRACLALVGSIAGRERIAPVAAEARWLAGVLGPARDWDVLATGTLPPLAAALARDPAAAGVARLARSVERHRKAARDAAREAVRSLRFQRLLLGVGALASGPSFGTASAGAPAQGFAARVLAKRHRRLVRRGDALAHGHPEERHAVRIAAKKLRYASEFFTPADPPRRNRAYVKALSRLQDALGHWNDLVTATRLADGLADEVDRATLGAVRGWAAAQATALEPEIDRAWRRFAGAEPFWTPR